VTNRPLPRQRSALLLAAAVVLCLGSSALAVVRTRIGPLLLRGSVIARSSRPVALAAFAGHVVYAMHDGAAGGWVLAERTRRGSRWLPVAAERRRPEPTMGSALNGDVLVVWADDPGRRRDQFRLMALDLRTESVRVIPGTTGALRGSVDGDRVVFVRADADHVHRLYEATIGGRHLRRLPLPAPVTSPETGPPRPAYLTIRYVTVLGSLVAYVLDYHLNDALSQSELWLEHTGSAPHRVAVEGTGGAASGFREFFAPRLLNPGAIVVFDEERDQGNAGDTLRRLTLDGKVLDSIPIGLTDTDTDQISSAAWDAGHLYYSLAPYQGDDCQPFGPPRPTVTCPVLDSGPLTF
jgi:hypothetical protein